MIKLSKTVYFLRQLQTPGPYSIRILRKAGGKHYHCDNLFGYVGCACTIHKFHSADSAANPIKGKWDWHEERIWSHISASERPLISATKTPSVVSAQHSRISLHCLLRARLSSFIIRPLDGCVKCVLKTPGFWYVFLNTNLGKCTRLWVYGWMFVVESVLK